MKDLKPIIFIVIVLILTAVSAYPQRPFTGKVVEVIDGKTFVIQMQDIKLTGILQYVEIPEPEQPLNQTIKEHLQTLILNKTVSFLPRRALKQGTVGQLMVVDVDISGQMLRDGAAWYLVPEKNTQTEAESVLYQDNEKQAKAEKRGVWGVENLKPSWEYRAERDALRKQKEEKEDAQKKFAKEMEQQRKRTVSSTQPAPAPEMWANLGSGDSDIDKPLGIGGLRTGKIAVLGMGHISVPSFLLNFPNKDFLQKVESRILYAYKGDAANTNENAYMIGFVTTTKEFKFVKPTNAAMIADGQKLVLGKLTRFPFKNMNSVSELLIYRVTREQLQTIAKAKKVSVQLGGYSGTMAEDSLTYLSNLLDITY